MGQAETQTAAYWIPKKAGTSRPLFFLSSRLCVARVGIEMGKENDDNLACLLEICLTCRMPHAEAFPKQH